MKKIYSEIPTARKLAFAQQMRENPTYWEARVWRALKNWRRAAKFGVHFQCQVVIRGYIVDFYCDKLKLAIELDGKIHSSAEAKRRDAQRDEHLFQAGVTVMRFANPRDKKDVTALFFAVWPEARYRLTLYKKGISTFSPRLLSLEEKTRKPWEAKRRVRKTVEFVDNRSCKLQKFTAVSVAENFARLIERSGKHAQVLRCPKCHSLHVIEGS